LGAIARSLTFAAILLLGGGVVLHWFVLRLSRQRGELERAALGLMPLVAAALLLGLALQLITQFSAFRDPLEPARSELAILLQTGWGRVWKAQLFTALAALLVSAGLRRFRIAPIVLSLCALVLCVSPTFSSHARASENWFAVAMTADMVHLLAATSWIGGLAVLAWLTTRTHFDGSAGGFDLGLLIRRFSPIALTSASLIAATGTVGVLLKLKAVSELWLSGYGRVLTLKLVLFFGVLGGGYYNWRKATPRLLESNNARAMARSLRIELTLAALLILVTAVLVVTPPPGE
jgi:putative copper resistance protein D